MLYLIFKDFSHLSRSVARIKEYFFSKGFIDEDDLYNVKLAIYELAGNVLKHSNKTARAELKCEGDLIRIYIKGSNPFDLPRNDLPSLEEEYGRGIFIVRQICESLEYYDGGKEVCVSIKCRR